MKQKSQAFAASSDSKCLVLFLVKAQNSEKAATAQSEVNAALIVNDTVVKDTVTKKDEPVKTELSAPTAFVNDTVVKDTASKDKPAEPVKE